jgi:hypothetical protein
MKFTPETLKLIDALRGILPKLQAEKAAIHQRLKAERQCGADKKDGGRCGNWSVVGGDKCKRHGGTTSEPKACTCPAYQFPHRRRGGLCNYPNKPFGLSPTPAGKRRYYKRQRKTQVKTWLKEIGL